MAAKFVIQHALDPHQFWSAQGWAHRSEAVGFDTEQEAIDYARAWGGSFLTVVPADAPVTHSPPPFYNPFGFPRPWAR